MDPSPGASFNSTLGSTSFDLFDCARSRQKLRAIVLFLVGLCGFSAGLRGADTNLWIIEAENENTLTFNLSEGTITYTNGVVVRHGNAVLSARKARLNQSSGEVMAEGSVRLQQENEVWYGERIEYNFKSRKILATDF